MPKSFANSQLQSDALSTVLISCYVKSLTCYGYDIMLIWPDLGTVYVIVPFWYVSAADQARLVSLCVFRLDYVAKNTNHISTKLP